MSFNINKLVQPECGGSNPLVAAAQQISLKQPVHHRKFQQNPPQLQPSAFIKEYIQQNPSIIKKQAPIHHQVSGSSSRDLVTLSHQNQHHTQVWQNQLITNNPQQHWDNFKHQTISNLNAQIHQQMLATGQTSAGDQLEIKYRNDMISQTKASTSQLPDYNLKHQSDNDDLQFWQALSQKYNGIATGIDQQKALTNSTVMKQDELSSGDKEGLDSTTKSLADLVVGEGETYDASIFDQLSDKTMETDLNEYHFDDRNPLNGQFEDPFTEGLKRLEQGDIPSAALLFEAAVQKEPENSVAWRYLGTTQAQNEKDNSAIRALRNCLQLDEKDQQARLAIAVSLANETQHYEASKHLVSWLTNHEKYNSVNSSLEDFHRFDSELSNDPFYINSLDQKHYNYVRDKFVEAARMTPNNPDPDVQNALGVLFNMRGDYTKAVDCFKAALSVRSNDCLLWNRLGATLANGLKSDEAVIAYRKALEISPGFLRSRYNLAISLIHLYAYDEAAKQLIQILNMQAAGKGSKNTQIRTRSITSSAIWNTLKTVATLMNRPELYPIIDGRDLARCNSEIFKQEQQQSSSTTLGNN